MDKVSNFALRFAEALELRKISQADICRMTGINTATISRYSTGERDPKAANLYAIASALSISDRWLYGYDVPMEAPKEKDVIAKMVEESFGSIVDTKQLLREALGASIEFNDVYFTDEDLESIISYIRFKKHEKES